MDLALATTYQQLFLDNLGVISVSNNPRVAFLGEIMIDEDYRGQGYSCDALKLLNEFLDKIGAEFSYLQVVSRMSYTASIYKKSGYILTENSLKFIQENSYIEENNKLKKIDIKEEEAEKFFLDNSSFSQPYMVRYRYGNIPK